MKYTKLFRHKSGLSSACAQIHSNAYDCSLEHILDMVAELKKDFPTIDNKDIQVQKYGGRRVKGITFVEAFFNTEIPMPSGYEEVREIEYIL